MMEGQSRRPQVLLVGAGHAHLFTLSRAREYVEAGVDITLVAPGRFWYSGMGPGLLTGLYRGAEDSVEIGGSVVAAGGSYFEDEVEMIDVEGRSVTTQQGQKLRFDAMSLNVGSAVPLHHIPGAAEFGIPVKPVRHFLEIRRRLLEHKTDGAPHRVVVIGGGAAGCETAANAIGLAAQAGVGLELTLVSSSDRLLQEAPERGSRFLARWFRNKGAEVRVSTRVVEITRDKIVVDRGSEIAWDTVVVATGVRPPRVLESSSLTTGKDGAMVVDEMLQSVSCKGVFGGGDCIALQGHSLDRVGVYAVRESPILHHNLLASVTGKPLHRFTPQRSYLLILNLGDGSGLLLWRGMVVHARWAMRFKHWLDWKFISTYLN